jgi:hypothetical protein
MSSIWHTPLGKSVRGRSHIFEDRDCEDAWLVKTTPEGDWTALCISDGAGSAQFGKLGAEIVVERFTEVLLKIAEQLSEKSPGSWVNDAVIEGVLSIRKEMKRLSGSEDISDYHATLVALLIGDNGGFYVHLGDGAIFGSKLSLMVSGNVEIDRNCLISKPENGEYSNETFFVTEHDWFKHLRMSPLPRVDWVAVATDGGCELALTKNLNNFELNDFFVPRLLMNIYSNELDHPNQILDTLLSDRDYDKLTQDDKTLVIIYKRNIEFVRKNFKLAEKQKSINLETANKEKSNPKDTANDSSKDINIPKEIGVTKKYLLYIYTIIVTLILLYDLGSKYSYFPFNHKNTVVEGNSKEIFGDGQHPENIQHQNSDAQNTLNEIISTENIIFDCDINNFFLDKKTSRCRIKLNNFDNIVGKNKSLANTNPSLKYILETIYKYNKHISSIELNLTNKFFKNEKGDTDYNRLESLINSFISAQIMIPVIKEERVDADKEYTMTIIKKND